MEEKVSELMVKCPQCMDLFPANSMQLQEGFMECAICGAKIAAEEVKQNISSEKPKT